MPLTTHNRDRHLTRDHSVLLSFGAYTDKAGREVNEDNCTLELQRLPGKAYLGGLAAVADGMGGGSTGGAASDLAIKTLVDQYFEDAAESVPATLQRAVNAANSAVYAYSVTAGKISTVGTTMVALAVVQPHAYITSVGDSRAYLVRDGQALQITRDHNWAEQQVETGHLSRQQAERHPNAALLTHVLGQRPNLQIALSGLSDGRFSFELELQPGDALVLCSDGLSNALAPTEIAALAVGSAASRAAARLVARAKEQRTSDNATAVVLHYGVRPRGGWWPPALLWLCVAAVLLGIGGVAATGGRASAPLGAPTVVEPSSRTIGSPTAMLQPIASAEPASTSVQIDTPLPTRSTSTAVPATATFPPTATLPPAPSVPTARPRSPTPLPATIALPSATATPEPPPTATPEPPPTATPAPPPTATPDTNNNNNDNNEEEDNSEPPPPKP